MSVKNRLFLKNGHDCILPHPLEDLHMFRQSSNILTQIKNILIRFRMASEVNFRTQSFLRSQRRVDIEHRRHFKHIYIVHPFSDLRKYWEIFMILVLFSQVFMIPLEVSFYRLYMVHNFTQSEVWRYTRIICDIICLTDVIASFMTGYCDEKRNIVILNPKKIAVHYVLSYFVPDLVSSIPTAFENKRSATNTIIQDVLTYMSLLKLFRIISLMRYCKQFCQNYGIDYSIYKIGIIVVIYILYYHILSCFTIFVATSVIGHRGYYTSLYNESRRDMPYNLLRDVSTTYFYILYEATRVINNAGHLWIAGNRRIGFTLFGWFVSRLLYMYLTSLVIDVIIAKTSSVQKYIELVSELRDYMDHKHIPNHLKIRLLDYQEFRFQKTYFKETEILSTISGQLKQDVVLYSCRKLVENVDFFKNLPLSLLVRIVTVLEMETFMTNDVIIKYDAPGDCMYFIATGTVAIYTKSGREVRHLFDGDHFGEIALVMVSNPRRIAAVVAVEPSELYKLDRVDFVRAIMPYPDLLLKIERIANERMEETMAIEDRR